MGFNIILVILILALIGLAIYILKQATNTKPDRERFAKIISKDKELEKLTHEKEDVETFIKQLRESFEEKKFVFDKLIEKQDVEASIEQLRESYEEKKIIFDELAIEAAIFDEEIELIELGFYKPHFDFDTSEKFKEQIRITKSKQKEMIANKRAVTCITKWSVRGNMAEGKVLTDNGIKLSAKAFNNECDAVISNVRWNNAAKMEMRVVKAFDSINKLNGKNAIQIADEYLELKLEELRLTYEYKEKKQQEKEEQSKIKQQIREENKLAEEVENTFKEEAKYKTLLEKAQYEVGQASGKKLEALSTKISELKTELEKAHAKSERAKSMAQETRAGHVYVISNTGSFGEDIYKIGMTRRLDPLVRVKELGDASVPFTFDIHAMIYSDDAPSLEKKCIKFLI